MDLAEHEPAKSPKREKELSNTGGTWPDSRIKAAIPLKVINVVKDDAGKVVKTEYGPAKEQRVRIDTGLYLFLRRKADGNVSRHWQYRAQVNGQRPWATIGPYPAVSLADARQAMLDLDKGKHDAKTGEKQHPAIEAKQQRAQVLSNPTVEEAFDAWIEEKRLGSPDNDGKPVRESTVQILTYNFDMDIRPLIGKNKIGKLIPAAVRPCIERAQKRGSPGAASHVYRTLRGLMTFAIRREYITGADPMRGIRNPKPYRPALPNAASDTEIVYFLKLLEDSEFHPSTRGVIELQLLTGLRSSEARLLDWSRVDLEKGYLVLADLDVKTGKPFLVHLSAPTIRLLQTFVPLGGKPTGYVFPGELPGKPLGKTTTALALRRKWKQEGVQMGKKLKPHDVRKTFRTMLKRLKVDGDVAGLCINHTEEHVLRKIYDGHDYWGEMVEAWDLAGAHIDRLRAGGAVIVPLARPQPIVRAA